jgi:hypothetical protein
MALKLNHQWNQKEHAALQSGIMLSVLNRQGASPRTSGNLKETNLNIRLNFHTGYQWELGKKKKVEYLSGRLCRAEQFHHFRSIGSECPKF